MKAPRRHCTTFAHPSSTHTTKLVRDYVKSCSIYFVEGFPQVLGKFVVLTIIDRFSKMAHFIPLGHLYMALTVAQASTTSSSSTTYLVVP